MVNESSILKFRSRNGYNTFTLQRSISSRHVSEFGSATQRRPAAFLPRGATPSDCAPHRCDDGVTIAREIEVSGFVKRLYEK